MSFDRPYAGSGDGEFLGNELPLVALAESLGLDLTYWTDLDLHRRPELLIGHRALISLGHDEYWSTAMREGVTSARDAGVNLAFLGANAVFRHIRMDSSAIGPDREEVNYKDTSDPLYGVDDAEVTVDWRYWPLNQPESSLLGAEYDCYGVRVDGVITDVSSWVFAGTGCATDRTCTRWSVVSTTG